ncbi:glutathione peroxidase [Cohnella faecalis]|uniref:Glutathione peroxidase n=1 Tax=Cohnella faecalis TaxID=2315694 RepID=A0A398CXP0_9BACL|nr:glutathione peroxidase [Cohnella faecalis]RIE04557.1 glutathione peroxidase [Cohnella faecalis]
MSNIYEIPTKTLRGEQSDLSAYRGKVLLIVNTASKCGYTKQYEGLQKLYEQYKDQGFEVLGFPSNQFGEQEPGTNEEVEQFCSVNYGVSFPLFDKTDVRGEQAHPLFRFLTEQAPFQGFDQADPAAKGMGDYLKEKLPDYYEGDGIKWNFTKFLVDRNGNVVERFESPVTPAALEPKVKELL